MGGPMPPNRVQAWVESLPEATLTSNAWVVIDLGSYPYILAYVSSSGLAILIGCQDSGWQRTWYITDVGEVKTMETPSFEEIKAALNLPAGWVVKGNTVAQPSTESIKRKLSAQE